MTQTRGSIVIYPYSQACPIFAVWFVLTIIHGSGGMVAFLTALPLLCQSQHKAKSKKNTVGLETRLIITHYCIAYDDNVLSLMKISPKFGSSRNFKCGPPEIK